MLSFGCPCRLCQAVCSASYGSSPYCHLRKAHSRAAVWFIETFQCNHSTTLDLSYRHSRAGVQTIRTSFQRKQVRNRQKIPCLLYRATLKSFLLLMDNRCWDIIKARLTCKVRTMDSHTMSGYESGKLLLLSSFCCKNFIFIIVCIHISRLLSFLLIFFPFNSVTGLIHIKIGTFIAISYYQ